MTKQTPKVKPLTKQTMTLEQFRKRTLKVLAACRKQLRRKPHECGQTDEEFIHDPLETLMIDIKQDMEMEKPSGKAAARRYDSRSVSER